MKKLLVLMIVALMLVGCANQEAGVPSTDNQAATEGASDATSQTGDTTLAEEPSEPPHEHAYAEAITSEAACEADGVKTFTCDCGDSYTESIPAIGHSYGEFVYNNNATTQADGTETATCSLCGDKSTRTKEGTKLLYDGYDEFGNGFIYGANTENDRMGNPVKQKIFEANNPYPLYQVVDGGGTDIYFYFIFTGSANKGPEYNACYDAGIAILFARFPEKTVQMAQGEYVGTYNGQVIYKALPITGSMGPDGRPIW